MNSIQDSKVREKLINLLGAIYLLRRQKHPGRKAQVTVIDYHRISAKSFRKHLDYIRRHYQVLSPRTFLDWLDDEYVIDEPSVVFTFDDGYMSFYEEIYPILKEAKISAFMFVPTGLIETNGCFWEDELQVALHKSNTYALTVGKKRFYLHSKLYRMDFYESILRHLRFLDETSRHKVQEDILDQLQVDIGEDDMKAFAFLNWFQVREMENSGWVLFGSHSVHHPNLSILSNGSVRFQVRESKRELEHRIGRSVYAFAYPYGDVASFDGQTISEIKNAGYLCAFTTVQGAIKEKYKNRFKLKRLLLFDYQNDGVVAWKLDRFGV